MQRLIPSKVVTVGRWPLIKLCEVEKEIGGRAQRRRMRLKVDKEGQECRRPPYVIPGPSDSTRFLGEFHFSSSHLYTSDSNDSEILISSSDLYAEFQNSLSKCPLFIMDFTSKSTCSKTELIIFPSNLFHLSYSQRL